MKVLSCYQGGVPPRKKLVIFVVGKFGDVLFMLRPQLRPKEQIEIVVQQVELVLHRCGGVFFGEPTSPACSNKTSTTQIAPALPKSQGKGSGHTPPCPR